MRTFRLLMLYILFLLLILAALPLLLVSGNNAGDAAKEDGSPVIKIENADGAIYEDTLEHFVMGVVAAEMPRSFPEEALKAQAVAARTFIYGQIGKGLYNGADTCTDPAKAQAWLDIDSAVTAAAAAYDQNSWQKVIEAVRSTSGLIVTYQGEAVSTTYCSTCGGQTASAKEVWGKDQPWLVSVACPYDQDSPKYETTVRFTLNELADLLDIGKGEPGQMAIKKRTASGRVAEVAAGSKTFSGSQMRQKLSLNSTNFTFSLSDDGIVFTVRGYGHGVGLCQYGAKGLAEHGLTYEEILYHYYQGIKLKKAY